MALPTKAHTWDVDPNNAGGIGTSEYEDYRRTLFALVEGMIGGGSAEVSNPWIVSMSSNSSTADATNNWSSYTDVVWASGASAHSWIVLADPNSDYEICIQCNDSTVNANLLDFIFSPSGVFTGGTTTARPTAADEQVLYTSLNWHNSISGAFTSKVHVGVSTDGNCTYVVSFVAGVCCLFWVLCELDNPETGLTDPTWIALSHSGNAAAQQGERNASRWGDDTKQWMDEAGTLRNTVISVEAIMIANGTIDVAFEEQTAASTDSNDYPMGPVGVWGLNGVFGGKKGNIPDLQWCLDVNNVGDQYPGSGTLYQWSQLGGVAIPWDSLTAIQVT